MKKIEDNEPPTTASQNACRRRNTGTSAMPQNVRCNARKKNLRRISMNQVGYAEQNQTVKADCNRNRQFQSILTTSSEVIL